MEHFDIKNFESSRIVTSEEGNIQLMSIDEMDIDEKISFIRMDGEGEIECCRVK